MAKIPTLGTQVDLQPLRPTYQSDVSGSYSRVNPLSKNINTVTNAVDGVNDTLFKDTMAWQVDDNERQAKDLDVQYANSIRQIQYGDGTNDNSGYFGNSGQAALDNYGSATTAVSDARTNISNSISNPAVKKMFDQVSASRMSTANDGMTRYSLGERKVANVNSSNARLATSVADATAGAGDDNQVNQALRATTSESLYQASLNGSKKDSPEAQLLAAQNRGATLAAAVESMATDNPDRAKALFDKFKDQTDPITQLKLRKTVDQATLLGRSQSAAASIVSQGLSLEDSLKKARDITEPSLQKATVEELKDRFQETWMAQEHARSNQQFAWAQEAHSEHEQEKASTGNAQQMLDNVTDSFVVKKDDGSTTLDSDAAYAYIRENAQDPDTRAKAEQGVRILQSVIDNEEQNQRSAQSFTENEVTRQWNIQKHKEEQATKDATSDAFSFINSKKGGLTDYWAQKPDAFTLLSQSQTIIPNLERRAIQIAKGDIYASVSDGKTLANLRAMPPDKLAAVDINTVMGDMTETENVAAMNAISSAHDRVQAIQSGNSTYINQGDAALKRFAPKQLQVGLQKQSDANKAVFNDAQNAMTEFVTSFTSQGKVPPGDQIEKEAQRLMLKVTAPGTQINSWAQQFIPYRLNGRGTEVYAVEAAGLSQTQRDNAIVDYDEIPQQLKDQITDNLKGKGIPVTEGLLEQIAGAIAVGDKVRARKLTGN